MASDDELETVPDDTEREDLRQMIREELSSVIGDLRSSDREADPDPEAPTIDLGETPSMTVRDIEAAAERAVRRAMLDLNAKAPAKKAPPKKAAAEPEPTPVDPPKNWLDKMRDKAWS